MQYLFVKNMHMTFAVVTILLFNIRFFLLLSKPEKPLAGIWKVLPHLNDTTLADEDYAFHPVWQCKLVGCQNPAAVGLYRFGRGHDEGEAAFAEILYYLSAGDGVCGQHRVSGDVQTVLTGRLKVFPC